MSVAKRGRKRKMFTKKLAARNRIWYRSRKITENWLKKRAKRIGYSY